MDITNFNNSNTTVVATIDSIKNGTQHMTISPVGGVGVNASGSLTITSGVTSVSLTFTTYTGGIAGSTCEMVMTKL